MDEMAVELSDAGLWLGERVLPADDVGREELLCAAIGMFNLRKSRCAGLRSRLPSARMFGRVVPENVNGKAGSCGCLGGQPYVTHDTARQEGNQVTNLRRAPGWKYEFQRTLSPPNGSASLHPHLSRKHDEPRTLFRRRGSVARYITGVLPGVHQSNSKCSFASNIESNQIAMELLENGTGRRHQRLGVSPGSIFNQCGPLTR